MKILNLDNVTPPAERAIGIAGVNYPIPEVTVAGYLMSLRLAKEVKAKLASGNAEAQDEEKQMKDAVSFICTVVPSMTEEVVRKLTMHQISVIIGFLNGVIDEQGQPITDSTVEGESPEK